MQVTQSTNEIRLQDYVGVIYRKKWAVIISFALILGVSTYTALSTPPVYRSSATIRIDARTLSPTGEVVRNTTKPVEYYAKLFQTGIFQKEVVDSLSSDVQAWVITQRDQLNLNKIVREDISLQSDNVKGFFIITASASDPELAYRLSDISSRLFRKHLMEVEFQSTQDTDSYLNDQIDRVQAKVEEHEEKIYKFLRQHALSTLQGDVQVKNDFTTIQQELEKVKLSQELTRLKIQSYQRQQEELVDATTGAVDQELLFVETEIRKNRAIKDSLDALLAEKLQQYSEDHPEVMALDKEIKDNRRRLDEQLNNMGPDESAGNRLAVLKNKIIDMENQLAELNTDAEYYAFKLRSFANENPTLLDEDMERQLELNSLQRSKELYEKTYNMLIQRRAEQGFRKATQSGGVAMIDPANQPSDPMPSNAPRQILFGALIGLFLGLGAAFLLEYMDSSLKSSEDVSRYLDLPLIGEIPKIKNQATEKKRYFNLFSRKKQETNYEDRLITNFSPKEPIPEAYRNVRTSLQFASTATEQIQCFVVSSPSASEGKSLTTSNLSIGFAQSGKKTLIIDTDLRRPVMHKVFSVTKEPGITDVLTGQTDLSNAIRPIEGIENLHILPAGHSSPNPGELINSKHMDELLEQLKQIYDIVLLDSPPVIAAIDSAILGSKTQGVLLVFHMDETKREAAKYCIEQLTRAGSRVIGGVLNNIDVDKKYGHYYSYRYYSRYKYYYDSDESKPKSR